MFLKSHTNPFPIRTMRRKKSVRAVAKGPWSFRAGVISGIALSLGVVAGSSILTPSFSQPRGMVMPSVLTSSTPCGQDSSSSAYPEWEGDEDSEPSGSVHPLWGDDEDASQTTSAAPADDSSSAYPDFDAETTSEPSSVTDEEVSSLDANDANTQTVDQSAQ